MNQESHPLGMNWGSITKRCGDCVWSTMRGPGTKVLRCVAAGYRRVSEEWRCCDKFESSLNCLDCGACCGPAFDVVEVSRQDPVRKKQPDWILKSHSRYHVRRTESNYCAALCEDTTCSIYEDRPQCCRDFERGSANCIFARRRVKISDSWR